MTENKNRISFRVYLTRREFQCFQFIATMLWERGMIERPTISKLSKMALNVIVKEFIEQHTAKRQGDTENEKLTNPGAPIKRGL